MQRYLRQYFGSKEFYRETAKIAIPLSINNLLQSSMSIVDTMMVSSIGMVTAVGTAAQIDTLSSMISYGIIGGMGIFAAQFFGADDTRNQKRIFGLSLLLAFCNAFFWFLVAALFGREICMFYMPNAEVVSSSLDYLSIAMWAYIPQALGYAISNMLRCNGQAKITLHVSIVTMLCNVVFNACFIYGLGPFPMLGVAGAAIGTLIASLVALAIYMIYCISSQQTFIGSFREMFDLRPEFVAPIMHRTIPLIFNEALFGFGTTLFIKAFGQLGKQSMDAYYVANQIFNMFLFCVYGYGNAVSISLGNTLGQGKTAEAKIECDYHLGLSFVMMCVLVVAMTLFSKPMVSLFGLTDKVVYNLAVQLLVVFAVKISMRLFNFILFSILKSGGDSKIIQFLDSGLLWLVGLPSAFIAVNGFGWTSIVWVFLFTQLEQLVRLILGLIRLKKGYWIKDLTVLVK